MGSRTCTRHRDVRLAASGAPCGLGVQRTGPVAGLYRALEELVRGLFVTLVVGELAEQAQRHRDLLGDARVGGRLQQGVTLFPLARGDQHGAEGQPGVAREFGLVTVDNPLELLAGRLRITITHQQHPEVRPGERLDLRVPLRSRQAPGASGRGEDHPRSPAGHPGWLEPSASPTRPGGPQPPAIPGSGRRSPGQWVSCPHPGARRGSRSCAAAGTAGSPGGAGRRRHRQPCPRRLPSPPRAADGLRPSHPDSSA